MDLASDSVPRRRRGAELEDALLQAAWDEVFEHGYAALTIDAVAQRAGTSRPVIYRRWPSKADLVHAAVLRTMRHEQLAPPDTGSLRGDLVEVLHYANERRLGHSALLIYYLGPYFQETGTSPADLRREMFGDEPTTFDMVIERAVARAEIDASRLTPRLRSLAFDLYRHEALMTLEPVPDEVIDQILDEVFLPLVTPPG